MRIYVGLLCNRKQEDISWYHLKIYKKILSNENQIESDSLTTLTRVRKINGRVNYS
jgi:hypothetical protein